MATSFSFPLSRSIYVKVDKSLQIIDGITHHTTVSEVIQRLANKCRRIRPQVLLEVWNGCSRKFQNEEILLESLNKWGQQTKTITLIMMDSDKYENGLTLGLEINKIKTRPKKKKRKITKDIHLASFPHFSHKFSYKKLPLRHCIHSSRQRYYFKQEKLMKLKRATKHYKEEKESLLSCNNMMVPPNIENDGINNILSRLNPQMQARYTVLSNDIRKTTQSNDELLKHKNELRQAIISRLQEIKSLQATIDTKQKQLKYEKQTFRREEILEDSTISDLETDYEEMLTNLKAKHKIAQLQSMKIQELTSTKMEMERQLNEYAERIQNIKIQAQQY